MKKRHVNKSPLLVALGGLSIFLIAGVWAIMVLVEYERQRDLADWQITLGVMADSQSNDILRWVNSRFAAVHELAGNGSLQFYLQQLYRQNNIPTDHEPAQLSFLRNLIRATAEREGFIDRRRLGPVVAANLAFQADKGLILFDRQARMITSTPGMSRPDKVLQATVAKALSSGEPLLYNIRLNQNNQPIVGFIVPVFALQLQAGRQEVIGVIAGLENARDSLFPLFVSTRTTMESGETLLVTQEADSIVYLSPLADGTPALKRRLAANAPDLAAAYAVKYPGSFLEKIDYDGSTVLLVSRELPGTPWVLVQKIDIDEALREPNAHRQFLFIVLFLVLLLIASLLVSAWWYSSSAREQAISGELLLSSRKLKAQTHVLNAINDNITDFIFLVDPEMRVIFANKAFAQQLGLDASALKDKSLSSILGPASAGELTPFINKALEGGATIFKEMELEVHSAGFTFHAAFTPVPYGGLEHDAVLVDLHDLTLLQETQEKQTRLLQQLVKALMRAIDLHDPYWANHSAKTADITEALARTMKLEEHESETLQIAANLCNLGKLSVPRALLAKIGDITPEEQDILRKETEYALEILADTGLDEAIKTTIIQKNECLDGSGYPQGLQGDEIIRTARILAATNAFVAMTSPRAYRNRLSVKEAMEQLMDAADSRYDRQVLAALFHVVENEIDWSVWMK